MIDSVVPVKSFKMVAYCTRQSDGSLVVKADIDSISYSIWDAITGDAVATNLALLKTDVVFDTLQQVGNRRFPSGYNFGWIPPLLPPENKTYRYRVQLNFTDGSKLPIYYERRTIPVGAP